MNAIMKIMGGIGILIAIYLFLAHGTQSVKIINSIGSNMIQGISTLQGNTVKTA